MKQLLVQSRMVNFRMQFRTPFFEEWQKRAEEQVRDVTWGAFSRNVFYLTPETKPRFEDAKKLDTPSEWHNCQSPDVSTVFLVAMSLIPPVFSSMFNASFPTMTDSFLEVMSTLIFRLFVVPLFVLTTFPLPCLLAGPKVKGILGQNWHGTS